VLETASPWLILLDIYLPIMNGPAFAQEARERGISARILVMTARSSASEWAEEVDADGYLAKPFEIAELLDAVARHRPQGA